MYGYESLHRLQLPHHSDYTKHQLSSSHSGNAKFGTNYSEYRLTFCFNYMRLTFFDANARISVNSVKCVTKYVPHVTTTTAVSHSAPNFFLFFFREIFQTGFFFSFVGVYLPYFACFLLNNTFTTIAHTRHRNHQKKKKITNEHNKFLRLKLNKKKNDFFFSFFSFSSLT